MENAKCQVCGWEIKDDGVPVKVKGQTLVVCCTECADTLKDKSKKGASS